MRFCGREGQANVPLKLSNSLRSLRLKLWDEKQNRLVGFGVVKGYGCGWGNVTTMTRILGEKAGEQILGLLIKRQGA